MCCRLEVRPCDPEIAATILAVGMFARITATEWQRTIPEEGCKVMANIEDTALRLSITPSISVYAHHHGKRITAGVYFEIACKYAEKVGGEITQLSNVAGCNSAPGISSLILASYPELPMDWQRVCNGFREELLAEPSLLLEPDD